ncbi:hypothetical protein GJ496_008012 [Pomphorhynchus laevis]|nr:hypothetical protein GJ496_008012 [Pomphorhynchus laevis]
MSEVHVIGQIIGAKAFPDHRIFCKWSVHAANTSKFFRCNGIKPSGHAPDESEKDRSVDLIHRSVTIEPFNSNRNVISSLLMGGAWKVLHNRSLFVLVYDVSDDEIFTNVKILHNEIGKCFDNNEFPVVILEITLIYLDLQKNDETTR